MASLFRSLAALILIILSGCGQFGKTPPAVEPWYPTVNENGDPVFAVFESRIPCADCQKIKFALALYRDPKTKAPTTYKLARVYVARSPEDRMVNEGHWMIKHGTRLNPQATVYQLDANAPSEFRWFWAIGEDILFILDQDLNPRVGTAGYGYALNKIR
ncbi:MAG: copper resistance protein NlpE N-terminal domain-containing protein [Gammaproteobacteria bacterium]